MLSFKELQEKKTKIKLNPKKDELMEKSKTMKPEKGEDCHCDHTKNEKKKRKEDTDHTEGTPDVASESAVPGKPAEKLKTDRNMFNIPKDEQDAAKERLKAKAAAKRKQLNKEEAYVSQEEVSEESDESIEEKETSNLLTFGQFSERKELSIDDQMRISREAAAKRKPYKDGDHQRARAAQLKAAAKNAKKDTRTDAQKMTDATGPRPGSRYRGD